MIYLDRGLFMCGMALFGSSATATSVKAPSVAPPKDTTAENNKATANAAAERRRRASQARGRQSTILTSAQGDTSRAPTKNRTLLGY